MYKNVSFLVQIYIPTHFPLKLIANKINSDKWNHFICWTHINRILSYKSLRDCHVFKCIRFFFLLFLEIIRTKSNVILLSLNSRRQGRNTYLQAMLPWQMKWSEMLYGSTWVWSKLLQNTLLFCKQWNTRKNNKIDKEKHELRYI